VRITLEVSHVRSYSASVYLDATFSRQDGERVVGRQLSRKMLLSLIASETLRATIPLWQCLALCNFRAYHNTMGASFRSKYIR
jgi:hypothetical protein